MRSHSGQAPIPTAPSGDEVVRSLGIQPGAALSGQARRLLCKMGSPQGAALAV